MIGNLGFGELLIIFLVILLLFGAKRVPEVAKSLGKSIREFKKGMNSAISEVDENLEDERPEIQRPAKEAVSVKKEKANVA
jgi:sec-independent protein translocase protein TatA